MRDTVKIVLVAVLAVSLGFAAYWLLVNYGLGSASSITGAY